MTLGNDLFMKLEDFKNYWCILEFELKVFFKTFFTI